jgi:hypothetical protein
MTVKRTFRSSNHILYDLDPPIGDKAIQFREQALISGFRVLSLPDAIHLSTAAIYGANEVHTFDDGEKDNRFTGLLELNGAKCVDGLIICKPTLAQPNLPLDDIKAANPESPVIPPSGAQKFHFEADETDEP